MSEEQRMNEPDLVVLRPSADLPEGFLPDHMNGEWLDRSLLPFGPTTMEPDKTGAVAVPTGRFETRDDGAVAEVYEVREVRP